MAVGLCGLQYWLNACALPMTSARVAPISSKKTRIWTQATTMLAFVPVRNLTARVFGSQAVRSKHKILRGKGTSKMKVKCRGWVSAFALLGIITTSISSKSVDAQQEVSAFAVAPSFNLTTGIATDSTGNVYVANFHNTILKITPAGVVMTLAGTPDVRGHADGIDSAASFIYPVSIATDSVANLYVADKVSNTIRKITPTGVVTTLAGTAGITGHADGIGGNASFNSPVGVATDSTGNVYVADYGNDTIRKVAPNGEVTTLAGMAGVAGNTDGFGAIASFSLPYGIATDNAGNIFVAEMSSHAIRKITPAGMVTTLAGKAGVAGQADGIGADASFSLPHGVAADKAGNVYVADYGNDTIRMITPAGAVTTIAGKPGESAEYDGIGGAARFSEPVAVATDNGGNVFVLEADNIREVTPTGVVTTIAGPVFGPWHFQDQFCEWDVAPDNSGTTRSGTRRCSLNVGTRFCSSSIEVTSANPGNTKPKPSLVYDNALNVLAVDTKFRLERAEGEGRGAKGDPPVGKPGAYSWLHYVVKLTVSSTSSCK
jgi:streptogramin lyase